MSKVAIDSGKTLQEQAAGVSLSWTWMGVTRVLKGEEKEKAAELWDADPSALSLSKRIINTKNEWFAVLTKIKSKVTGMWIDRTLPWVDKGVRLIRKEEVDAFDADCSQYAGRLADAVAMLVKNWGEVKQEAKKSLADLYREADYVADPSALFGFTVSYPSLTPPDWLQTVNPKLYELEKARVAKAFDKAVEIAVEAYGAELHKLVAGMAEKLAPGPDGQAKKVQQTSVETFLTFIDNFRKMNVSSSKDLEELMSRAEGLVAGLDLKALKKGAAADRAALAQSFEQLALAVESKLVPKQRRKLVLGAPALKLAAQPDQEPDAAGVA